MIFFIENSNVEYDSSDRFQNKLRGAETVLINLAENFGQHNAIMAGFNNCVGDFIITIDDDLQHQPEFIPDILKTLREFNKDVCYTNYKNRKHIGWKRLVSNLNNIVSSFILNKPLEVYMSSYRGLTKKLKTEIINYKQSNVYIDGLIILYAKKIGMINIDHKARKYGESYYNLKKLFILWSNMFLNFSFFPFRSASIFGIIILNSRAMSACFINAAGSVFPSKLLKTAIK